MELVIPGPKNLHFLTKDRNDFDRFSQAFLVSGRKFGRKNSQCSLRRIAAASTLIDLLGLPSLNTEVLLTSLGASGSLFSTCALVAWMQKSEYLPGETPVILSQVAFRVLIPCYLMSNVSTVLATHSTGINVAAIPVIAVAQILTGAFIGKLACLILYRIPRTTREFSSKTLAKKEALVTTACAFGNTLTLPLIFLRKILPPQDASIASGYLALFIVGWSPFLWTVAYHILSSSVQASETRPNRINNFMDTVSRWFKRLINPPLLGILLGIAIGLCPASTFLFHDSSSSTSIPLLWRMFRPVYEAVTFLGSAAPSVQVVVLACSLAGVIKSRSAKLPHFWGPREIKSSLAAIDSTAAINSNQQDQSQSPLIGKKELCAICGTRLLFVPFVFSTALSTAENMKLLTMDPICKLTLLVLSAMPSAQNLVVLAQLRPSTRPLAKEMASLMLLQYIGSLVPVTLWLAVFMGRVG